MNVPLWQLERHQARFQLGPLQARLDLSLPSRGIFDFQGGLPSFESAQVLGIRSPTGQPTESRLPIEAYVRANQLVLAYSASEAWPIQLDARWIARTGLAGEPVATWDLIVSVHTDLLDSRPELGVVSTLGCSAGLRLLDAAGRFAELDLPTEQTAVIGPAGGPGCVLFRFPKGQFSYAEMVHPADFHHDEVLTLKSNESCTAKISHRLFVESLEKGVVLRARIRGVVLPRDADCRLAADAYWAFAAADPPLGA